MNSTPDGTFDLDFYTLSTLNTKGYGEGRYVLGSATVMTDSSGNATFSFAFPTPSAGAQYVTATATDANGNTSEFAEDFGTDNAPTARIAFSTLTVSEGVPVTFDGSGSSGPDGDTLTYTWSFGDLTTGTGATPVHTYTKTGTYTVTLTVHDGFGGTNTATATVIVVNMPPEFTPDTFEPPETYTTSAVGNGFGAAVASVYGNVAVGTRSPIPRRSPSPRSSDLRSPTPGPSTFTTASPPMMRSLRATPTVSSSTSLPTRTLSPAMSSARRWRWSATSW